jgi:hypothetical protein
MKSEQEKRARVVQALKDAWGAVGAEICGEGGDILRDDVIDVATDELRTFGKLSEEDFRWFLGLNFEAQREIGKEAFPFSVYGL